jgi:hypothetical protein
MNLYMKMCYRTFAFLLPPSPPHLAFVGFHFELIYPATRTSMMIQLRLPVPVLMFLLVRMTKASFAAFRSAMR